MSRPGRADRAAVGAWGHLRNPRFLLRTVLIAGIALAAAWLSVSVGAAALLRSKEPAVALRFFPQDARAKVARAELMLARLESAADIQRADRLARSALERDATIVSAWRVLGLMAAASDRREQAVAHFETAERLSRRDLSTQLWLIEQRVLDNDIPGALRHHDIAMRISIPIRDQLIPVLVSATASPYVVRPLARTLARAPEWAPLYYAALIQAPSTGAGGADLVEDLRRFNPRLDLSELRPLPSVLAQHGDFEGAMRSYRSLAGKGASEQLVSNGNFERANAFPALEWDLADEDDLEAELSPAEGARGQLALAIRSSYGGSGTAARQLLLLPSGEYRLSSIVGLAEEAPLGSLKWQIACADNGAILLDEDVVRRVVGYDRKDLTFRVPGNCPAQWLRLEATGSDQPGGGGGWVDAVAIRALS